MVHDDPFSQERQPIQQSILTGEIDWQRIFLVRDPQYSMGDYACAFAENLVTSLDRLVESAGNLVISDSSGFGIVVDLYT
jgi:hypothetical protein